MDETVIDIVVIVVSGDGIMSAGAVCSYCSRCAAVDDVRTRHHKLCSATDLPQNTVKVDSGGC